MSKKASKVGAIESGTIIEYRDGRDLAMAVLVGAERGRLRCVSRSGRELVVKEGLLLRVTAERLPATASREEWASALDRREERIRPLADGVELAVLWELLEDGDGQELEAMTGEYFGADAGDDEASAMLWALVGDSVYFKRKGDCYQPKDRHAVEDTVRQLAERRERQRIRGLALTWAEALLRREDAAADAWRELPDEAREWLGILEAVAIGLDKSPLYCRGLSFLGELGLVQEDERAFELLVRAGVYSPHENLLLRRHGVTASPSAEAVEAATLLAEEASHPGLEGREDLREHAIFAVDDADTREIDDGLHFERLDDGWSLGVHIADVAAWVRSESTLDREARSRGLTHYMPDQVLPMLPQVLSFDVASLRPGEDRLALSLLVDFDEDFQLRSWRFARSVVRVHASLTYEEADERIAAELSPWVELHRLATVLQEERLERGASRFDRRDCKVRVFEDDRIVVKTSARNSAAQVVVSEAMILANRLAAKFCSEKKVPIVYRVQPGQRLPDGRVRLERLKVGVHPGPHMGLGIDGYTQATSPLRRYGDLCVQRQLSALVEGVSPPMDEEAMTQVVAVSSHARLRAEEIESWSNRYWLCLWLQQRGDRPFEVRVVEPKEDHLLVESLDTCLYLRLFPPPGVTAKSDDLLWVRASEIQPRSGTIKIALSPAPSD